jgi:hypothetical protein
MANVKVIRRNNNANTSPIVNVEPSRVHVVVKIDGVTRSSIATIRKDMSEAVKRDLKVLRKFGLVTP